MTAIDDALEPLLGKKSADALAEGLGLRTVGDLLRHYPRRYDERGRLTSIASLELDEHVTVLADVAKVTKKPMRARRGTMTEVIVTDGTRPLSLVFFSQKIQNLNNLTPGKRGLFAGKVSRFNKTMQLAHPEFQLLDSEDGEDGVQAVASFTRKLIPVYPAVSGLPTWSIARCVEQVIGMWDGVVDPLPGELIKRHNML